MKVKLLIFFLSFWIAPSILIDFVAAPAIFRNVSDLQEAGRLGMVIFMGFNTLEVILSLFVFIFGFLLAKDNKIKKPWIILFTILVMWAGFFRFHVSPSIIDINKQRWELASDTVEFKKLTKDHEFYHQLYVRMEGTKVILLVGVLILAFRIKEEEEIV